MDQQTIETNMSPVRCPAPDLEKPRGEFLHTDDLKKFEHPRISEIRNELRNIAPDEISDRSLLKIPLVRQAFLDPNLIFIQRAVDGRWSEQNILPETSFGFNPYCSTFFYATHSKFHQWLDDPFKLARPLNEDDHLMSEILFLCHDYLHIWTVNRVREMFPELKVGTAELNEENLEDYVFIHLVTEAAATVGLDYWYLSKVDINDVVDIGTNIDQLTISYREKNLNSEFRRISPDFFVQDPKFFCELVVNYCSNYWFRFPMNTLRWSNKLKSWLNHELGYGKTQRYYSRLWLSAMAGDSLGYLKKDKEDLKGNVTFNKQWQRDLVEQIAVDLFAKVKNDKFLTKPMSMDIGPQWHQRPVKQDYRFCTVDHSSELPSSNSFKENPLSYVYFVEHFATRYNYGQMDEPTKKLVNVAKRQMDTPMLTTIFRGFDPIELEHTWEPGNLFFLK